MSLPDDDEYKPKRDSKGRLVKGSSGNPSGKASKAKQDIKALCRRNSVRAVRTLVGIMQDVTASTSDRIKAATYILDRGYGRPESEGNGAAGLFAGATIVVDTGIRREPPMVDVTPINGSTEGQ